MRRWIEAFDKPADIELYYNEYDNENSFQEIMNFKENRWHNYEVPYIRYYREGKYLCDSNYVSPEGFLKLFGSPSG